MAGPYYTDISRVELASNLNLSNRLPPSRKTPRVMVADPLYTMLGTEAATETVRLCKLPNGCKIIPHLSKVIAEAGAGATIQIQLGDEEDTPVATRYGVALNIAAGGAFQPVGGAADLDPYALAPKDKGFTWITMTFSTLTTPSAGKKIRVKLAYIDSV